jgi:hypothetical protein
MDQLEDGLLLRIGSPESAQQKACSLVTFLTPLFGMESSNVSEKFLSAYCVDFRGVFKGILAGSLRYRRVNHLVPPTFGCLDAMVAICDKQAVTRFENHNRWELIEYLSVTLDKSPIHVPGRHGGEVGDLQPLHFDSSSQASGPSIFPIAGYTACWSRPERVVGFTHTPRKVQEPPREGQSPALIKKIPAGKSESQVVRPRPPKVANALATSARFRHLPKESQRDP